MRTWGIAITIFYAFIVIVLLVPGWALMSNSDSVMNIYRAYGIWIGIGIAISGEALLLFLSADTSQKRLKPRAHILISTSMAATFLAILAFAGILSLAAGIRGDKGLSFLDSWWVTLAFWAFLWSFWGIVFHRYCRDSSTAVTQTVSWLLKGSILELLVAVPCHVIVRHRKECSAPVATGFGITTGIAIMLLSFGPSVLLLYKKRLEARSIPPRPAQETDRRPACG